MKKVILLVLSILLAWTFNSCSKSDSKPVINFTSLNTDIATAQALLASTMEGVTPGDYPTGSKATLSSAITMAQSVVAASSTTQDQVGAADIQLTTAVAAYKAAIVPPTDLASLIAEVAVAQGLLTTTTEGDMIGQYPIGSKATLAAAIAVDQADINQGGTTITPEQEADAATTLTAAVTTYQSSINVVTVWFFGDSATFGYGASTPDKKWTTKLSGQKQWKEVNQGVVGETLLHASETTGFGTFFGRYQFVIQTKPAYGKYIFISYGANDTGFAFADYTTTLFSSQLQTIITFANSKGWQNSDIVVVCGYFENSASWTNPYGMQQLPAAATMDRYNSFITAAQTVAQSNSGVIFVNPFNTYDASELDPDNLHPNDAGHAAIATYVASLVP